MSSVQPPPSIGFIEHTSRGDDVIDVGEGKSNTGSTDRGRSDLLAAIRATGGIHGAGLKKADDKGRPSSSNSDSKHMDSTSAPNAGGGLDLMGEITRKLAMRRKGMSGKSDQEPTKDRTNTSVPKPSGAMGKISSLIPPPPENVQSQKNEDSDDDW